MIKKGKIKRRTEGKEEIKKGGEEGKQIGIHFAKY